MDINADFYENVSATKEKVLEKLQEDQKKLDKYAKEDKKNPGFYYAERDKTREKFAELLDERDFPEMTQYPWGYDYQFDGIAYEFMLVEYGESNAYKVDKTGHKYVPDHSYTLLRVESEYISVEEYAANAGVDPKTVMQQIRRGKIRMAKKMGVSWMIPTLMTVQPRGYMPACYRIEGDIRPLSDKYNFLPTEGDVMIKRNFDENGFTNDYLVACFGKNGIFPSYETVMSQAEREKFELGLIAHPNVKYVQTDREIPGAELFN